MRSAAGAQIGADEAVGLMGNHEAMMRLALDLATPWDDALDALESWLRNGGGAVVRQFAHFEVEPVGPEELLTVIRVALPDRIRVWLEGLGALALGRDAVRPCRGQPSVDLERFLAGPWNTPLAEVDEDMHWAWVRWPFLEASPGRGLRRLFRRPRAYAERRAAQASHDDQIRGFRLNLDAGSGRTGLAKMGVFRGAEVKVLTALGPTNAMLRGYA